MKKIILIIIIALIAIVILAVATGIIAVSKDGKIAIGVTGQASDESISATRQAMHGQRSDESISATRQAMHGSQQSPINPVMAIVGIVGGIAVAAAVKRSQKR